MNDNKKIEYVRIESSKKETTCAVCLRVIRKNSPAKTLVVDDVLRATTLYCPTGVKHIESATEYREYLTEVLMVEEKKDYKPSYIQKKIRDWEIHRIRKGYLNPVQISFVTKEHKKAHEEYVNYQIKKLHRELQLKREKNKEDEQEILQKIVEFEINKN